MRFGIPLLLLMPTLLLLPLITSTASGASNPTILVQKTWGSSLSGATDGRGVAVDASGNIYVAGDTNSFGAGGYDVFLLKYDASGVLLWQKTWGGSGDDYGLGVAVDGSGNIYVTGDTTSFGAGSADVILLKFASNGTLLWQKTWGGSNSDIGYGVAVDSGGSVYVTGYTASFGAGGDDAFLLKFGSSGALLWQKTWGGSFFDLAEGLGVDFSGNIYVTGGTQSFGAGSADVFILKFNSTGSLLWQKTWGGTGGDWGQGVVADSFGNIYVTGYSPSFGAGSDDLFLLKLTSAGGLIWQRTWGGGAVDQGFGVSLDSSGGIYVTGDTQSFGAGNADVVLLKFDSSGALLWQRIWGGSLDDVGYGVVLDHAGNAIVAGFTSDAPPYTTNSLGNSTLGTPSFSLGTPALPVTTPSFILGSPAGTVGTPSGSESYVGTRDSLLLKYGTEVTFSCAGANTCWVQSNSTITATSYVSSTNTIHMAFNGTSGTHGFANVTFPKSAVPSQDPSKIKVYVNSILLQSSKFSITSNTTHFFVYVTYTFQSPVSVDISLGIISATIPTLLPIALGLLLTPILIRRGKSLG